MFALFVVMLIIVDVVIVLATIFSVLTSKVSNKGGFVWQTILLISAIVYCFRFWVAVQDLVSTESTGNPLITLFIPPIAVVLLIVLAKIKH